MSSIERPASDRQGRTAAAPDPRRGRSRARMLRDGLERILRGHTGALIVLGYDKTVESLCTGGFPLDVEFSATRLRELAKMDGAIVLDREAHPDRLRGDATSCPTRPSRPRSPAPGTAPPSGSPSRPAPGRSRVSQSMRIIALYVDGPPLRARRLRRDPVPRQPGAGHARALQDPARRGRRHAVRAGDRGPRHRPRRRRGGPAAGDGAPHRRARSRATSSSSAPTAGCSRCSSTS